MCLGGEREETKLRRIWVTQLLQPQAGASWVLSSNSICCTTPPSKRAFFAKSMGKRTSSIFALGCRTGHTCYHAESTSLSWRPAHEPQALGWKSALSSTASHFSQTLPPSAITFPQPRSISNYNAYQDNAPSSDNPQPSQSSEDRSASKSLNPGPFRHKRQARNTFATFSMNRPRARASRLKHTYLFDSRKEEDIYPRG